MKNNVLAVLLLLSAPTLSVYAMDSNPTITTTKFETVLGGTRLIYDLSGPGASISIKNPQSYPMLVQSKVVKPEVLTNENMPKDDSFIVTPPLFRLDGLRQTALSVVRVKGDFPKDRESLRFLCVKGIPPQSNDVWAKNIKNKNTNMSLNIATQTCIKLLIRPDGINISQRDAANSISWYEQGGFLVAENKSAIYIQPGYLNVNGDSIKNTEYMKPFSMTKFKLTNGHKKIEKIEWAYIDDNGATSEPIISVVK